MEENNFQNKDTDNDGLKNKLIVKNFLFLIIAIVIFIIGLILFLSIIFNFIDFGDGMRKALQ